MFVIDILRATTTISAALHAGAKAIIPVGSTEEALRLAQTIGSVDVLLAGEKNCARIPGFHLGNSPLEMTESAVRGKTLIVTTTNGTKALLACQGAAGVYLASAANLGVAAEKARECVDRDGGVLDPCVAEAARTRWTTPTARGGWPPPRSAEREPDAASTTRRSRAWTGPPLRRSLGASAHVQSRRP